MVPERWPHFELQVDKASRAKKDHPSREAISCLSEVLEGNIMVVIHSTLWGTPQLADSALQNDAPILLVVHPQRSVRVLYILPMDKSREGTSGPADTCPHAGNSV